MNKAPDDLVDMEIIMHIESGGYPAAVSRAGALGLYQIMPVVLQEFNARNPGRRRAAWQLLLPRVNTEIARWYMLERIPEMLLHFKQPVTLSNCLIAYNAGIKSVLTGKVPGETWEYLRRYARCEQKKAAGDKTWRES